MKKLMSILVLLGAVSSSDMYSKPETTAKVKGSTGKITVKNLTNKKLYVAVYTVAENKDPEQFSNVYSVESGDDEEILRPKLPAWGVDREVYFSSDITQLMPDLFSSSPLRIKEQHFLVGNLKGSKFMIYPVDQDGKPDYKSSDFVGAKFDKDVENSLNHQMHIDYREGSYGK